MKLAKIFKELISSWDKKSNTVRYGIEDGYVYLVPDGYRMFKIPEEDFIIDMGKAFPSLGPLTNPKRMFNAEGTEEDKRSSILRITENKRTIVKIEGEKSYTWVNVKFLDYFEGEVTYRVSTPKAPVFVYENGEIVGIVLPVNFKEDE